MTKPMCHEISSADAVVCPLELNIQTTQISHFTASIIMAFVKLERLKIRNNQNHFAMKNRLLVQATKSAYTALQRLSTPHIQFT